MDRSIIFSVLLLDEEFAKLESRVATHVVTDVVDYRERQGKTMHECVADYLTDVRSRGTLTEHAEALAAHADRIALADANAAVLAWTSRHSGTRL